MPSTSSVAADRRGDHPRDHCPTLRCPDKEPVERLNVLVMIPWMGCSASGQSCHSLLVSSTGAATDIVVCHCLSPWRKFSVGALALPSASCLWEVVSCQSRSALRSLSGFCAGFFVATILFFAFQAITADAVQSDEATFVPITPCRLFDTRPGATNIGPRSIPLGEDSPVAFQVTGTNGDCTIPAAATAVSINLTGVSPTAVTNLRLYPANAAVPNASVLNMVPGQGATPNKLDVKLSPDGKLAIYNRFGTVHVIGDVMGYYRHDGFADLEARINELEALTASMSKVTVDGQPTVRFTGVNVQVVSGSGGTGGAVNGKGNLIVGYNENNSDFRTGSHNLIVGASHSYSSYGGFVTGFDNTVSGVSASVSGGTGNTASGDSSSVSGGHTSTASNIWSSVSGGQSNTASGAASAVSGGAANTASGDVSSVTGGFKNTASIVQASVSGGWQNTASGINSSVSGGSNNTASGDESSVSGGGSRSATGLQDWRAGSLFEPN